MIVTSTDAGRSPAADSRATTSCSRSVLSTPRGVRSSLGNRRPRSPCPAAPSSASATACRTTSPSEWPARAGAPSIAMPPRRSGDPGPNGWLSWPNPTRGTPAAPSCCSARTRSSGSVTLRFVGSPGIAWTVMVQASSSAASSVKAGGPSGGNRAQASRNSRRRAPCGVCAAARPARSTVPVTRWPSMRLSVSATDRTGIAAPCRCASSATAATSAGDTSGRAPSCTSTTRSSPAGSVAARWRTPAATDAWRVAPPATTSAPPGSQSAVDTSPTRSGATTTTTRSTPGADATAATDQARSGRPATTAASLSVPPIRRDDPAATTTASTPIGPLAPPLRAAVSPGAAGRRSSGRRPSGARGSR